MNKQIVLLITFDTAETKPMLGAVLITNSNKMNEKILERLKNEFAFIGDEKISGHTAMKIINNIVKESQIFEEPQKPKLGISVVMPRFLLRPFYLLLKKDMVKRLSEKHGEQFIDDVMDTFGMPTNLMDKYFKR